MELEAVGVAELDFGQWCTSSRVVDYVFNNTSNVAVLLSIIKSSKLRGSLVQASVGRCLRMLASSLPPWTSAEHTY